GARRDVHRRRQLVHAHSAQRPVLVEELAEARDGNLPQEVKKVWKIWSRHRYVLPDSRPFMVVQSGMSIAQSVREAETLNQPQRAGRVTSPASASAVSRVVALERVSPAASNVAPVVWRAEIGQPWTVISPASVRASICAAVDGGSVSVALPASMRTSS